MVDPTGLGCQKNTKMLNPAPKNVGCGSQNHLKSYLQVPKTVTREEAYKGGQKLQTYIYMDLLLLQTPQRLPKEAQREKFLDPEHDN